MNTMKSFPAIPSVAREGGTAPRSRPPDYWSKSFRWHILSLLLIVLLVFPCLAEPDLILHNGKVVSMDTAFSIHEAIAVRDGRIVHLGKTADVLKGRGPRTEAQVVKAAPARSPHLTPNYSQSCLRSNYASSATDSPAFFTCSEISQNLAP